MPLTIYTHQKTPEKAYQFLEELGAEMEVEGENWCATFQKGMIRKKHLKIRYDADWCSGENWSTQIAGMANYIGDFEADSQRAQQVREMIVSLEATYGIVSKPDPMEDEDWLSIILSLSDKLGGILFHPHALFDSHLRTLLEADGSFDEDAEFPEYTPSEQLIEIDTDDGPEEVEADPPAAQRVVQRLYVLLLCSARGLHEMNTSSGATPSYAIEDLREWASQHVDREEFEPEEWVLLGKASGDLSEQETINAVWKIEGAVVLAWALGLCDLPQYDDCVDVDSLFASVNFLGSNMDAQFSATLKSAEELELYSHQIFALHWRMVDMRVNKRPVDFKSMEKESWFGPIDISWAELEQNDLVIKGQPISIAGTETMSTVSSIASERHIASNWLAGQARLYSEIDAST